MIDNAPPITRRLVFATRCLEVPWVLWPSTVLGNAITVPRLCHGSAIALPLQHHGSTMALGAFSWESILDRLLYYRLG